MPTVNESKCCQEIEFVKQKLDSTNDNGEKLSCITLIPRFYYICIDTESLDVAMLSMADLRADSVIRPIASK